MKFGTTGDDGPRRRLKALLAIPLALLATASATSQTYSIAPDARARPGAANVATGALHRPPRVLLAEHRALSKALDALAPQRPGVVDAYVVVAAFDSDPVFGREAREAGRVLARRYGANGRTIVLTADERGADPVATPANLALALARVGELADRREDALILYTTSHGSADTGLAYRDARRGAGAIGPARLGAMLDDSGLRNRLVMLQACYSGVFVPQLANENSAVITAAAANRSSFGCEPGNEWTFFGDALINRAFRTKQPLDAAFAEARASVAGWEAAARFQGSEPRISIGARVARWLGPLEARTPAQATRPVGRSPASRIAEAPAR